MNARRLLRLIRVVAGAIAVTGPVAGSAKARQAEPAETSSHTAHTAQTTHAAQPPPTTATGQTAPRGSDPPSVTLGEDSTLQGLLRDALARRPEMKQAHAALAAAATRGPQARVLPDPALSLGIQNDGFRAIQVGKMETSWLYIVASQTLPWFGKRDLREAVADTAAKQDAATLSRTELSLRAELTRAYLDLLLAREELTLLARLEALWLQSEGAARARYEAGEGPQSDLLRAQLERARLKQRRFGAEAEETRRREALNSLRGHSPDEAIPTTLPLLALADPVIPDLDKALAEARAQSPELARARFAMEEAAKSRELARKETLPDVTLLAGVMPRGGLEPMWQAGVSFTVPVWSRERQSHLVDENTHRLASAEASHDALERLLLQRVRERVRLLEAATESNGLYRQGILVQSEATMTSTLAQYRVGRVAFTAVLEAVAAYVNDVDGFLQSIVGAQKLALGLVEMSFDDPGGGGGLGAPAMAGPTSPVSATGAAARSGGAREAAPAAGAAPRPGMGGM